MGRRGRPKGKGTKTIPKQYDLSEDLQDIGNDLIRKYHPSLATASIAYLFVNKEIKHKGKLVGGQARTCSKLVKAISTYDFVIVISYPTWQKLEERQRLALLDHELEHCFVSETDEGDIKYSILPHDYEEFSSILDRHGLWNGGLEALGAVVKKSIGKENKVEKDTDELELDD